MSLRLEAHPGRRSGGRNLRPKTRLGDRDVFIRCPQGRARCIEVGIVLICLGHRARDCLGGSHCRSQEHERGNGGCQQRISEKRHFYSTPLARTRVSRRPSGQGETAYRCSSRCRLNHGNDNRKFCYLGRGLSLFSRMTTTNLTNYPLDSGFESNASLRFGNNPAIPGCRILVTASEPWGDA